MYSLPAGTSFAQMNLLNNGSFETGPAGENTFPGWDLVGPADNNSNYGVAHSGTSPDVAEQGSFYAYFRGSPTDSSQDCLGKTLNLIPGAQYNISYYLGTDGTTLGSGAAMYVVIGTSFGIDYSQDISLTEYWPNSASALPYQKFSTIYTDTNSPIQLSFHGIDAASSILLDNVSVTLVEPPLNVRYSKPNGLVFTWTNQSAGRLQASLAFRTNNWVTLTNIPVTTGITNQIVLPMSGTNTFYRLVVP